MRSATLTGTLGQEPKVVAPNGLEYSIIKFSIANNDKRKKNEAGQWEGVAQWFDIEFWTKNPQYWLNQLYKGTSVCCPCDVEQQSWKTEAGENRSKIIFKIATGQFPYVLAKSGSHQQDSTPTQAPSQGTVGNAFPTSDYPEEPPF